MNKLITIPTSPNFVNSQFNLLRAVGATSSPFSGKQRTQEFDLVAWEGTAQLPPMNRETAVNWQSFLLECVGTKNHFHFIDPDAQTPQGTYDGDTLAGEVRLASNNASRTLSFNATTKKITSTSAVFANLVAGDFVTISGANNTENNGTFKLTAFTSSTDITVDAALVTESSTANCTVSQNIKGSEALSLAAATNTATGTIKKGDYLAIFDGSATTSNRIQLVMATADATETAQSGSPNHYSVAIQPKLRSDLSDSSLVGFSSTYNKSRFRLADNEVTWNADRVSLYGITVAFTEVI